MKRSKRFLSILLVLCMTLGLLPGVVQAAGGTFADVKQTDWFYQEVQHVYEKRSDEGNRR